MYRNSKKPIDVSSLINTTSGTLAQINQKTNFLKQITSIVRQICPDLPVDTWRIGNIRENTVIIEVNSAVWSQRLQFEKNRIAQTLSEASEGALNAIQLKVAPSFNKVANPVTSSEKKPEKPNKQMSETAASQLRYAADKAPKSLQEKILKLAEHADKNKS